MRLATSIKKYPFLLISAVYFAFRLFNLTKLPIFNDEAIYLDWAWRETNEPGMLFYSLYDAKQPLLMWFFGIAMHLLPDPFFAGRLVSVLLGWVGMFGVFRLGKTYFNQKIGIFASLLYIVIPIFSFYDRQALMEAAIAAIGVWTLWFALKFWKYGYTKDAVFAGILLGIGFFIKSSALVFLAAFFLISFWLWLRKRSFRLRSLFYSTFSFLCMITLLLLQPKFWETLSSNNRYGHSISELLHFPIGTWASNFLGNSEIFLLFVTPVVVIFAGVGVYAIIKTRKRASLSLLTWVIGGIVLQTLLVKGTSQRYLVAYLPLVCLLAAMGFMAIEHRFQKALGFLALVVLFAIPIVLTLIQLVSPPLYFSLFDPFSKYSEGYSYVRGLTSGYGVDEAVAYIEKLGGDKKIFVGQDMYSGTPESAIKIHFQRHPRIVPGYFTRQLLGDSIKGVKCLKTEIPAYFVSKGDNTAGMGAYLEHLVYLRNPHNSNVIGIWKLKEECQGKTLPLQLIK
ncbi:MAG: glycosyltransferase family 39 protein [Candidatus Levybacteria bacterium]|nr:glycosyltransferase family 39 protein [Candidatus Levybacteria bacterium]